MADTLNLEAERAAFIKQYRAEFRIPAQVPDSTVIEGERTEYRWQGWCMARRAATKAAAPADAPCATCGGTGVDPGGLSACRDCIGRRAPAEDAREEVRQKIDLQLCVLEWNRAQSKPPIKIGREYFVAQEIAAMLARRASSVPAIPGTGRENEQAVAWALVSPKGGIKKVSITRQSVESRMARWLEEWPGNTPRIRPLVYGDADAAPSHPSEAKAGEDA